MYLWKFNFREGSFPALMMDAVFRARLRFPADLSPEVRSLIRGCLQLDLAARLSVAEVEVADFCAKELGLAVNSQDHRRRHQLIPQQKVSWNKYSVAFTELRLDASKSNFLLLLKFAIAQN